MKCTGVKTTIRTIAFFVIFALLFSVVQDILILRSPRDAQVFPQFYGEPKDSLDAVYIGSSNCFTYWNSLFAWEEYGINIYPLSCNSQPFFAAKHLIQEARKTQKKAKFIININSVTDDYIPTAAMHYLLDVMPFSLNKLSLIHHLSEIGGYSWKQRMEFYFPIIRYHSRISELEPDDFGVEPNGLKGALVHNAYLNRPSDVSDGFVNTDEKSTLTPKTIDYTNDLLDYCDSENLEVLFVVVPQAENGLEKIRRYNALSELLEGRGYSVLNLMGKSEEIGIDMTKDFYNGGHTNIHGSIKYTHYLSEILIEKYGFTDKREDDSYNAWDISVEKYREITTSKVLDMEWDGMHRDFALDVPSIKTSVVKKKVTLTWNPCQGAGGYAVYRKIGDKGSWEPLAITQECQFTDTKTKNKKTYYYTIVPFSEKDGQRYYGNYKYNGVKISL